MTERIYCIYKHTSPNGKAYIGQTCNYKARCQNHISVSRNPYSRKYFYFHKAIAKYGWDNFNHEILLSNLTLDQANRFEEFYISEHGTLSPNGYNLRLGGLNSSMVEETRAKISKTLTGKIVSEEHRKNLSLALTGKKLKPLSEEQKLWLSNLNKGKTLSTEHKAKIAASNTGKHNSDECKIKYAKTSYIKTYEKIIANPDKVYGVQKGSENCYRASITIDKKNIYLGSFPTEEEAFAAYKQKAFERYLEALKE
jgi:group I intron endonuclease